MEHNYEDIVRDWYNRLRPEFLRRLTARYSGLSLSDAENLYQDTFIAIQENLMRGRIKEDTSWSSYIMTIGMNLASHAWRKAGQTDSIDEQNPDNDNAMSKTARKVEDLLKTIPDDSDSIAFSKDPEVLAMLGNELSHTPEPCNSIIKSFYYGGLSMDEIAEEIGYKNATTAKAKKNTCMNDLILRLTTALRRHGFNVTPIKWKKDGKH